MLWTEKNFNFIHNYTLLYFYVLSTVLGKKIYSIYMYIYRNNMLYRAKVVSLSSIFRKISVIQNKICDFSWGYSICNLTNKFFKTPVPPALFTVTSQSKNCNNHKGTKFALAEKWSENVWPKLTLQRMLPTIKVSSWEQINDIDDQRGFQAWKLYKMVVAQLSSLSFECMVQ